VFLASASMHTIYLAYAKWLLSVGLDVPYIRNSTALAIQNRERGFIPRFLGHEVVVFVWS
jgi:hypothetical protein